VLVLQLEAHTKSNNPISYIEAQEETGQPIVEMTRQNFIYAINLYQLSTIINNILGQLYSICNTLEYKCGNSISIFMVLVVLKYI
jgi:hypothetical protein